MAQLTWLMLTFVSLMFGAFQGHAEATLTFNLGNEGPIKINQKRGLFLLVGEAIAAPWLPTSQKPVDKPTSYVPSHKYDHILKAWWCACREERKSLTNETEQQQFDKCERLFLYHGSELVEAGFLKEGNNNTDEMLIELDAWHDKINVVDCTDSKIGGLTVEAISAIAICGVVLVIAVIFCIYRAVSRKKMYSIENLVGSSCVT